MSIVTSSEFQRNVALYQDKARTEPVTIIADGKESLLLLAAEEFHRMKRHMRRAFPVEDLTPDHIAALEMAAVPPGHEHLDAELKGTALLDTARS